MTLRAKDPMVGDWVYNTKKEICKVCGVSCFFGESNFHLDNYSKENDGGFNLELEVFPIPLTPEILEKNGFDISDGQVMQYHFIEDGTQYHFSLRQMYNKEGERDGFSFYAFNVLTLITAVHELQHAIRLCGIDKQIEL